MEDYFTAGVSALSLTVAYLALKQVRTINEGGNGWGNIRKILWGTLLIAIAIHLINKS